MDDGQTTCENSTLAHNQPRKPAPYLQQPAQEAGLLEVRPQSPAAVQNTKQ